MNCSNLWIQSNSPGEISAWVVPIVAEAMRQYPGVNITLALTPCQYASSQEMAVASRIPGVSKVLSPSETVRLAWSFWRRTPLQNGAVLFLGGDPLYARLLAFKFKVPAYMYCEHDSWRSMRGFTQIWTLKQDGNLMEEAIRLHPKIHSTTPPSKCVFMCGSRLEHFEKMSVLMQKTVIEIKKIEPDFPAVLLVAPFISDAQYARVAAKIDLSCFEIQRGVDSRDVLQTAKLLVTLPGTNTAEAGYLGVPMLMILPFNHPEAIIVDGIAGLIGKLPWVGQFWMWLITRFMLRKIRRMPYFYVSKPNILLQKPVVKEFMGHVEPDKMAQQILDLYRDEAALQTMRDGLKQLHSESKISEKIITTILGSIKK